tara:strand:+ start:1828 stop:2442 length:615 start_codon:yes stop_codon:yes gene_type:complete
MLQQVKVSKMQGKLESFQAISTNTRTNEFCVKMAEVNKPDWICKVCYSHKTLNAGVYPSLEPALQHNSDVLSASTLQLEQMPKFKKKTEYIRLSAHGDLINETHLDNLIKIVEANPEKNFALWSKRVTIVRAYFKTHKVPANLQLVWSNPVVNKVVNTPPVPFHRVFNNVSHKGYKENCTGQKCKDCLLCYTSNDIKTIVEKVK